MKRYLLRENIDQILGQYGLGLNQFSDMANVSRSSIFQTRKPEQHPTRRGGMLSKTAWKYVNTFATHTSMEPTDAWDLLIEEIEVERNPTKKNA
ncbi:MAG: hypothetical protein AAGF95_06735 [Chloroflexota bacterium]